MQEDALLKTGPLAHPKKNYQKKKHDQFSQESYQSVPKVSRSRQKKKKQPNASELLSFKFETKEQMPPKMLVRRAPQGISDITLSPYFRFAVEAGDYSLYQNDPNMVIPWDSVRKITILADSEVKCPICLESELLSGRANKCGHYYCWPCIIRYLWTVNGPKRCPVCSDSLRPVDLRPVSFELYKTISERDTAKFVLIKRPKGMITLFKNDQPADNTFMGVLRSDSYHANINKISIYTQAIQDLQNDKASLQSALSLSDDFEKTSIENALNLLEKYPPNTTVPLEFNMKTSPYGFYYFYQLFDSQPYFLHPLNISMLKKELGEYENFPGTITGKILEIERVHIGDYEQKRYGQISHIAKNAIIYFVEIDMKEFCQKEVLGYYNEELVKREKARNRFRRIEEKIQAKISIRRKGEEEANSLLVTYFENPVIAPVRIVKVEEKPLEEKKEEVVETSASKSIWSNFGEVLKRPPREVKAQIEAIEVKEDSDEGPPKLTMFDLIKSRK